MWHILEQSAHPIRLYCVHHRKTLSDMIFMLGSMKLKIRSFGAFVILARWWQSKQVVLVQKSVMCLRKCHVAAGGGRELWHRAWRCWRRRQQVVSISPPPLHGSLAEFLLLSSLSFLPVTLDSVVRECGLLDGWMDG